MVSSGYSDSQNVDLWTNLTKSSIFSTRPDFFLLKHIGRVLTIRNVKGGDNTDRGFEPPSAVLHDQLSKFLLTATGELVILVGTCIT